MILMQSSGPKGILGFINTGVTVQGSLVFSVTTETQMLDMLIKVK